ncbi:MAG TPA: protoglobin domain-containing protein [Polyangiaceae bacterium]
MSETVFQELKRYVRFDARDARHLAAFHGYAAPQFPQIAQAFYERIREHEQAHAVFTGEDQIARLQRSLIRWLDRLCLGPHDEAYFEETSKIGRVHVKVGLPQEYMFTAMALIRVALIHIVEDRGGPDAAATRDAVLRLLDIELAVMLKAYRDDHVARLQLADRREKEHLEGELARAQARYINAVEFARVCILGLDRQGLICLFNRESERVTGFARNEVLGKSFVETLFSQELRESMEAVVNDAASGRPVEDAIETAMRTRTGKTRELRLRLSFVGSEGHDGVLLFVLGQDITDEKALAERTRRSEKLAAVGTLAAGLAHEIRNPLNGAQLHVSFLERSLKRSGGDPESLEAVKVVGDEIKRLAALVTEFLDFARPKPLDLSSTSLRALCQRVVQLISTEAQAAGVIVEANLPVSDIVLDADAAKLEQVTLNLIRNAVEALAPSRGGLVTVRLRRQPRHAILEVEDDGPGLISPEAPIFDAFYSTKPEGTGLGLAIVHRIVTDHSGAITVESRPGRTIFRLTLPLDLLATTASDG